MRNPPLRYYLERVLRDMGWQGRSFDLQILFLYASFTAKLAPYQPLASETGLVRNSGVGDGGRNLILKASSELWARSAPWSNRPLSKSLCWAGLAAYKTLHSRPVSETGRKRFRRARFQTLSSVSFAGSHRVPGRELSEFLSAGYSCGKANSPSFSQKPPSLPQNSLSSLF